jgi:hypothetical protein
VAQCQRHVEDLAKSARSPEARLGWGRLGFIVVGIEGGNVAIWLFRARLLTAGADASATRSSDLALL